MFAGIDIGGTFIKGLLADKNGKILSLKSIDTPTEAKDIEEAVLGLVEFLATSVTISKIDIKCIGIGCVGTIDRVKRKIIISPNIPALKNYPLAANVEKRIGVKVILENDATIALIGTWWKGSGSKYKNWVLINLGTGIGGGAIIDNKVYHGTSGNSFELGHISIDYNGRECPCGNRGCLELYSSAPALVEFVSQRLKKNKDSSINGRVKLSPLTARIIFEEALKKDRLAIEAFEEISRYLGYALANIINILSPEAVIIGGGLSEAHKFILPEVKRIVKERALPGMKESVEIIPLKDPNIIPCLGAVKISIDSCV